MYCPAVDCDQIHPCFVHEIVSSKLLSSIQSFDHTSLHPTQRPFPSLNSSSLPFQPAISCPSPSHHHCFPPHKSDYVTLHGCIEGANWGLSEPRVWNGCVLIFCHGYRPPGYGKVVELKSDDLCYAKLLSHGWIVAATSYRREGVILCDAITDILNLREFIADRYGKPRHVVLEGQSMGGMIVTLIAENYPQYFSGILAVGAALQTRKDKMSEEEKKMSLRHCPRLPLLYLTNESETGPIEQYIQGVQQRLDSRSVPDGSSSSSSGEGKSIEGSAGLVPGRHDEDVETIVLPALWEVSRAGHNWTKGEERYGALCDLMEWIKFGTFITRRRANYTIVSPPVLSSVEFDVDLSKPFKVRGATGKIVKISSTKMGVTCNFTEADLQRLGYRLGSKVSMRIREFALHAILDEYPYLRCKREDFMLVYEPEWTFCVLSRNNPVDHHDLIEELGRVKVGDEVFIAAAR